MRTQRLTSRLLRKSSLVFAVKACLALTIVFAASITINPTTYQAEIGSTVNVANGLVATDKGFSVSNIGSAGAGTSCTSPIQFSSTPGEANTTITAGHLVYDVQVNSTNTPSIANMPFNVTLVLASSNYGPLCIKGASTPAAGQTIDCKFDVGTILPASPYTFKVTVG